MMTSSLPFTILFLLLSLTPILVTCQLFDDVPTGHRKDYIVFMGDKPKGYDEWAVSSLHVNIIREVVISDEPPTGHILRSYNRTFNGFVARLTEKEAERIAEKDGVISVFPNRINQLQTTNSWDFIGFPTNVPRSRLESDIIIGVLDTGIWPESASFDDTGFGPVPSKWRGTCRVTPDFRGCNRKFIGAKFYYTGPGQPVLTARDYEGHGSHTASTAAGNSVSGANLYSLGSGTARGAVPSARIAVYKVCWPDLGCSDADILAAFDDAIADGVDIISVSIGFNDNRNYFQDSIAIGSFRAARQNIVPSVSAGNDGPLLLTIRNFAPWLISVAASTTNRRFLTTVILGNNQRFEGWSINTFNSIQATLIFGGDAPNTAGGFTPAQSRSCIENSLNANLVRRKIVVCDGYTSVREAQFGAVRTAFFAGAAGVIVNGVFQIYGDDVNNIVAPLPSSYVIDNNNAILAYIRSTSNPVAVIQKSSEQRNTFGPYLAAFSSRGPSPFTNSVLKPDLAAPGAEILAAYSQASSVSDVPGDTRVAPFNFVSGTSMACPHVSGAAAYLKSFYPNWSPAMIRSALMTTATPMNSNLNNEAEFAYGAGQINPTRALNPGLVYDAGAADYIRFLCGNGYSNTQVQVITGMRNACTSGGSSRELNYPAFVVYASPSQPFSCDFRRTVTNVGSATSTYTALVTAPQGLNILVSPNTLRFTSLGQTATFSVNVRGTISGGPRVVSASLVWDNGNSQVRSPIVVYVS
ncbi:cucumisin [Morus notabilis]|uniref:cucumisin n=1 Tax=Morus notabilis TaxID=981085 RepID=UPI000CECF829|nr:cucumisin [Morus notabilis]